MGSRLLGSDGKGADGGEGEGEEKDAGELAGRALQSASWAAAVDRRAAARAALEEASLILASQGKGRVVYDSRRRGPRRITLLTGSQLYARLTRRR